ncbi:hypothetical protein FBU30_004154 [Linnemannia zychae]|nr:hypothetical protein FBU30_004154 [Linnemannia zychae]
MSLIAHCPNLRELGLGSLEGDISDITMVQLGQFIGTRCPRLEIFDHSPGFLNQHYGTLVLVIMETLSAHSLKELYLKMFNDTVEQLAPMIAKHSQTLRKIHLLDYISLKSSNIQSILCCCSTLKEFKLVRYNTSSGCLLDVDGAKGQWACINLTYLEMPVEINDDNQDFYQRISNYVYRPTPLVLNTIEKEHFESLRRFYSQFGRLVDLEYLRLERAYPGRPDKNWPGYLRELSRLSRLKELRGSVGALSYEAIETVSIEEARHICQCWPQLRVAEFKCGQRSAQENANDVTKG